MICFTYIKSFRVTLIATKGFQNYALSPPYLEEMFTPCPYTSQHYSVQS